MTSITYPGPGVAGPASIAVELPPGWRAFPAPGVAFVAAPDGEGESGPPEVSLVASVRRVDGALGVAELAGMIADELGASEHVTEIERSTRDIGGATCALLTIEVGAGADAVRQTQALWLAPLDGGLADAVTLTISYPGAADGERLDELAAIVDSVRVSPAGSAPRSDKS